MAQSERQGQGPISGTLYYVESVIVLSSHRYPANYNLFLYIPRILGFTTVNDHHASLPLSPGLAAAVLPASLYAVTIVRHQ